MFLANPNNPTGTLIPADQLHHFLRKLPPHIVVVLDEAYNEYLPAKLKADSIAWLDEFPNLIVTANIFQGIWFGRLARRLCVCSGWSRRSDEPVRQPFNVNIISLAAAAAALNDLDFVRRGF